MATIANSESNFAGDKKTLPVIGKPHEHGTTYERMIDKLVGYVIKEFKRGRDLELLIRTQVDDFEKATGLKEPTISDEDAENRGKLTKYGKLLDIYLQREDMYKENKAKLFTVVFGQCTPTMVAGLKSQNGYVKKELEKDVVWIMKAIKKLSVGIDENENGAITAYEAVKKFYELRQADGESNNRYMERFEEAWKTADAAAGVNRLVPTITRTSEKYKSLSDEEWIESMKAICFLLKLTR